MELYGVRIPTIITENVAVRCAGCGGIVRGTPWRISILDITAPERAVSWAEAGAINPGPFEFHSDPDHFLAWLAQRGWLFCRHSHVREMMRPVWLPVEPRRLGVCDGIHRDDHEFVEPDAMASVSLEAVAGTGPSNTSAALAEGRARTPEALETPEAVETPQALETPEAPGQSEA